MKIEETLVYLGPNRRFEQTAVERVLRVTENDRKLLASEQASAWPAILTAGRRLGLELPIPQVGEPGLALAHWLVSAALELQRSTGHVVSETAVLQDSDPQCWRLVWEHEHAETGEAAGDLALLAVETALPGLRLEWVTAPLEGDFSRALARFMQDSPLRVLPADAARLIEAAARLDIPCVKLERDPYQGLSGDFRIRPNGLLKLGQSCHQSVVDGTLCVDLSAHLVPAVFRFVDAQALLRSVGLPLGDAGWLRVNPESQDPLHRLSDGQPVWVRSAERRPDTIVPVLPQTLRLPADAAEWTLQAERSGGEWWARVALPGHGFRLLLAGHKALWLMDGQGKPLPMDTVHSSLLAAVERVLKPLNAGMITVDFCCVDPAMPLPGSRPVFIDLCPAPRLDGVFAPALQLPDWRAAAQKCWDEANQRFLRWIYPPGRDSRIPIVAITGTNGKTTTSRMLYRIARAAGRNAGLASTTGVWINDKVLEHGDQAGAEGHHLLLESKQVDFAVLETARGALAHTGFMFDRCDVGVCLNVSEDHLGEFGIETLQDMVAIKRSVLQRARKAIVLNADYATTRGMLPFDSKVVPWLCSQEQSFEQLQAMAEVAINACVLESFEGSQWLVVRRQGRPPLRMLAVGEVPATLGGMARFNVSNAQHAICAALAAGLPESAVVQALRQFDASFECNPGRLNVYRGHPFMVMMDYAHNPDGMARLLELISGMQVRGRKILLYAVTGNRSNEELKHICRAPLDHFDHYICRRYPGPLRGRQEDEIPRLMAQELAAAGIAQERITVLTEQPERGTEEALKMACPGDLVVLICGTAEIDAMWQQVISFRPATEGEGDFSRPAG